MITINAIVAVNNDWGIGLGGVQTIVIPEDRRYFKKITDGGVVIAGRKTFEDFRKPLPNRKNIILTQDRTFEAEGAIIAHSVDDVLAEVTEDAPDRVFIIGGGEIYRLFLPLCTQAYVTRFYATPPSDTYFPDLDASPDWTLERCDFGIRSSELGVDYSFYVYRNNDKAEDNYV